MFNGKNTLVIGASAMVSGAVIWGIYELGKYVKGKKTEKKAKEVPEDEKEETVSTEE